MRRALVAAMLCLATLLFAVPAYAAVGDYSIDELSTEIIVKPDASADIVERQVVTFERQSTGMVWYLHVPESGESVRISDVRAAPVDKGGAQLGDWTRLQMVDSNPQQQGRNPGDSAAPMLRVRKIQPWYSYNIGDGMVRCYFPMVNPSGDTGGATESSASEPDYLTYAVEISYTIRHRVRVYRDVAELYWRYVNDSLPADSSDVNLQIKLPVPEGTEPEAVLNGIRAWGHGPNEGTFSVKEDGTITYHIDSIAHGNYAEAHVIFPAYWMADLASDSVNTFSSIRGAQAIEEEESWVDKAQREIAWDNNVRMLFLVIAIVVVVVGLVNALRHGRSPRARRTLVRMAVTLGIIALGEQLYFREPLTTCVLAGLAVLAAGASLFLPQVEELEEGPVDGDENAGVAAESELVPPSDVSASSAQEDEGEL